MAFASLLAEHRPHESDLVRRITGVYYEARYGRKRLSREQVSSAHRLVHELAALLKVRL